MLRSIQGNTGLLAVLCFAVGLSSQAVAQETDTEPNNSCPDAEDVGAIDVNTPFTVGGSLDTPPDIPDVDFFRFSATPGAQLAADHEGQATGRGTLPDPLLGLFDADCNQLAFDDDAGAGPNSRLRFEVPPDGVFVLAAASFPDFGFTGDGDDSGSYELTIGPPPPPIGSIAGRVVDARTGEPLPGNSPPFAFVELIRCEDSDCFEVVSDQSTDDEGRFRFERDFFDQPLSVGTYQVRASAEDFVEEETEPFDVGEGEDFDVGDIPLGPAPISFSDRQPCEDPLPQGNTCRYSVRANNNTSAPLNGLAWSLVNGFGLGSRLDFTTFEASTAPGSLRLVRERVALDAFGDQVLEFQFDVPPFVLGATFCAEVLLGVDPDPLVIPVAETFLFCITGTDTGFELMSASESRKISRSLRGETEILHRGPATETVQQPTK